MPKTNKLTTKEMKLVQAKASGKTHMQAYIEAGYAETTPKAMKANTHKILTRPHIQEAIQNEMAKQGVELGKAIQVIAEALEDKDINIRLKASDRAIKLWLQSYSNPVSNMHNPITVVIDPVYDKKPNFRIPE